MVRFSLPVLAAFALSACAPTGLAVVSKPRASAAPAVTATATAAPPAASAPAAPVLGPLLLKPATGVRVVRGTLQLDGGYVAATAAGTIIAGNGAAVAGMGHVQADARGQLISQDGGGLITNDGGGLISQDGGGLITNDGAGVISGNAGTVISGNAGAVIAGNGGSVIAPNGGTIIAPLGGNVIAPNGGTVIAPNGGSVIAGNGGSVIAPNGGTYKLAAAPVGVPAGTQVPAAGMLLQAVRMGVDQPLPLGNDAQGHPVYAIYTNASGHFEIYLPASETGTIHLRAVAPNHDSRLVYDQVGAPADGAELAIDEDTAQASRYLLEAFRGKLEALLDAPSLDDPAFRQSLFADTNVQSAVADFLWPVAHAFVDRVKAAGIPPARYAEVAEHASEALAKQVKLEDVLVDRANAHYTAGSANERAMDALVSVFKQAREQVAAIGTPQQVDDYFARQDYMVAANAERTKAGLPLYHIRKSTDVGDFLVERYFTSVKPTDTNAAAPVLWSLHPGVHEDPQASVLNHLYAAASGLGFALVVAFVNDEAAQAAVYAAVDALKP